MTALSYLQNAQTFLDAQAHDRAPGCGSYQTCAVSPVQNYFRIGPERRDKGGALFHIISYFIG